MQVSTAESDPLVERLRGRLPDLIGLALREPEVATTLDQVHPEQTRERIADEVVQSVLREADDLLRSTNPEIAGLRDAMSSLEMHERPDPADQTPSISPRAALGRTLHHFGLWSAAAYPVAVWQLWTPLSDAVGGLLTVLLLIAAAIFVLVLAYLCVRHAGRMLLGVPFHSGAWWALGVGTTVGYFLLVWRLWRPSVATVGSFWAWVIWIAAALLAGFIALTATVAIGNPDQQARRDEQLRIEKRALTILITAVVMAGAAVWLASRTATGLPPWPTLAAAALGSLLVGAAAAPVTRPSAEPLIEVVVPRHLSQDPSRYGSPAWSRQRNQLREAVVAAENEWQLIILERAIRPAVSRLVAEAVRPPFATLLGELDRSGVGQMAAGERFVRTAGFSQFRELAEGITGGAVGMAGPRGVGKSSLLEAFREGKFLEPGQEHIAVLESVPVRYDAREFSLHLYARVCGEVIKFCERQLPARSGSWPRVRGGWRRFVPIPFVIAGWLAVGFVGSRLADGKGLDFVAWLRNLWWPLVFVLAAGTAVILSARRRPAPTPQPIRPEQAAHDLAVLRRFAEERLREIHFQQKHTSGWSGKMTLLFGAEAARSGAQEVTRQPMSYPAVVHEFREFLKTTITCVSALPAMATPCVVIILDEVDKILAAEEAQEFVNEVKALFTLDVPGFLFLVSVSEDALASFERRGLPVRDAFDSAFDAIFRLEYLFLSDARAILTGRIHRMPEPFICLCHCLAGGLPRELIRIARQAVGRQGTLSQVAEDIVGADLRSKVAALRTVIAQRRYDDIAASELMRHVDAHARAEPTALLEAAAKPPLPKPAGPSPGEPLVELLRLQLETLGYLYYCGTVLEVFGDGFSEQQMVKGRDTAGDASFDTLTSVRQLFSVNARLAWLTVSAFRVAWGLVPVDPPS